MVAKARNLRFMFMMTSDASFKGKGIGHNSMNLGAGPILISGVISENDIKKNKLKAFGVHNGKVELMSYRLMN
ncbi:hypothetical protein Pst134EA_031794 [Puccinia striiformis f. sp. tritici]|uniref:uncharacterized protein n=1 Tax=Puccinia striiformis f. sp. tritici TaxID=168172 RepID=UPI002007B2D6|nr:uncharacterized protein Pst134EA_031794 [Puccinia striiformis f. sp. tritici]KAH9445162.1 hypothetical protein Pst134EA_031794 [Puccinia striiformis f. sp. tritici]